MFYRFIITALLALTFNAGVRAENLSAVNYTLRFPDALHHYVEVEADVPTDGAASIEVFMPVWTPGSYLIREYSRFIDRIDASSLAGNPLAIEKTTKNRWRIQTQGLDRAKIVYRLYGWDINVRSNWIEGDFAMINGAATYLTVAENYQRPYTVQVELPAGWQGVYTPLIPGAKPNTFTAPDYDTLVDSPLLAGSPQVDHFEIDGTRHYLVTIGGAGIWDNARAARNFEVLAKTQLNFWGSFPSDQPYYVFNLLATERGGLEHKQSLVMMADRWLSRSRSGLGNWLSLLSHEYFHVWNGKRLRPVELGPFTYEHEAYTRSLWVVEGVTSYYQHIMLRRAGFSTRESYLNIVSSAIASTEKTPGQEVQSLSDSSFDAWIKAYRPDGNSTNTQFSYYGGGALASLLLDAEIRRVSDNAKSLDDVLRAAFARFSGEQGYTEAQFIALCGEIAGSDLAPWFQRVIQNPGRFDYQPMMDFYGLEFAAPDEPDTQLLPNKLEPADAGAGWLGADFHEMNGQTLARTVRTGTPAYDAGLYVGDELIAIDGFRIENSVDQWLSTYHPGDRIELLISRRAQLITLHVTLGQAPREVWQLKIRADATDAQKRHLDSWLGEAEPLSPSKS